MTSNKRLLPRPHRAMVLFVAGVTVWLSPLSARQHTPLPAVELPAELDRVLRDYERAWRAGDEQALAQLFTPDGMVPRDPGWVRGRAAITEAYQNGSGPLQLRALAYATNGTVGYIIGTYGYGEAPGPTDRGKFILALRRSDNGRWLIVADLDSG